MILVGRYDSPFVRRVAVALHHYGLPFRRRVISTYDDFDAVLAVNPLGKVPALELADGTALVDSTYILDYLDDLVGPDRSLVPPTGAARAAVQRHVAVALGLTEKSVEYRTETMRRPPDKVVADRVARVARQIAAALAWLEKRASAEGWLCGEAMTQADVTAAIAVTNLQHKTPDLIPVELHPTLTAFARRCETLPPFRAAAYKAGPV